MKITPSGSLKSLRRSLLPINSEITDVDMERDILPGKKLISEVIPSFCPIAFQSVLFTFYSSSSFLSLSLVSSLLSLSLLIIFSSLSLSLSLSPSQLECTYEIDLSRLNSVEILPRIPIFSDILYESHMESQVGHA